MIDIAPTKLEIDTLVVLPGPAVQTPAVKSKILPLCWCAKISIRETAALSAAPVHLADVKTDSEGGIISRIWCVLEKPDRLHHRLGCYSYDHISSNLVNI